MINSDEVAIQRRREDTMRLVYRDPAANAVLQTIRQIVDKAKRVDGEPQFDEVILDGLATIFDLLRAELRNHPVMMVDPGSEARGYDRAIANLEAERYHDWVARQPYDVDLAHDEASRRQLAGYLEDVRDER